ncbi:MAG: DUF5301 domain-containing protein [Bacilli bacterium]|nr:DUF5301 domain-containing protein [Bacilli bacterium]
MKKTILTILLCGVMILGITGCGEKRKYDLTLPKEENIKSISFEKNDNKKEITDNEEIKDIIYVLSGSGKGRTTNEQSIQDYPVNAEDIIKIEFNFTGKGQSLLFIYKKNEKMYIEVPYNGIYRINGDEYNSMEKYVRDVENINNERILMAIKDNTLTNSDLTLIMKNNANQTYHYGPQYSLEKYENGKFITLEPKEPLSWNEILYNIKVNEEKEEIINWTYGYDKLKRGKYRLVRYFTSEENLPYSSNVAEKFYVEFEMEV